MWRFDGQPLAALTKPVLERPPATETLKTLAIAKRHRTPAPEGAQPDQRVDYCRSRMEAAKTRGARIFSRSYRTKITT